MCETTIISKWTRASVGPGTGKVSATLLSEGGEIGSFDGFLTRGVVGVECSAGDDVVGMFSAGGTCFVHVMEDCIDGFSLSISPCLDAFETEYMAAFDEESIGRLRPVVANCADQSRGVGLVGCGGIRCAGGGRGSGCGGPRGCRETRAGRRGGRGGDWGGMLEETAGAAEAAPGSVVITAGDPGQGLAVETGRRGAAAAVAVSAGVSSGGCVWMSLHRSVESILCTKYMRHHKSADHIKLDG